MTEKEEEGGMQERNDHMLRFSARKKKNRKKKERDDHLHREEGKKEQVHNQEWEWVRGGKEQDTQRPWCWEGEKEGSEDKSPSPLTIIAYNTQHNSHISPVIQSVFLKKHNDERTFLTIVVLPREACSLYNKKLQHVIIIAVFMQSSYHLVSLSNCFLSACHRISLQHCRWVFITFSCMWKCFSLLSCHLSSSLSHNTNRRRQIWELSQSRECSCSLLMISSSTICCYLFCGWVWVQVLVFVVNWDRKGKSAPLFSSLDFGKSLHHP